MATHGVDRDVVASESAMGIVNGRNGVDFERVEPALVAPMTEHEETVRGVDSLAPPVYQIYNGMYLCTCTCICICANVD